MRLGTAVRISPEAEEEWRHARESPTNSEAEAVKNRADEMRARARRAAQHAVTSSKHVSHRDKGRKAVIR